MACCVGREHKCPAPCSAGGYNGSEGTIVTRINVLLQRWESHLVVPVVECWP